MKRMLIAVAVILVGFALAQAQETKEPRNSIFLLGGYVYMMGAKIDLSTSQTEGIGGPTVNIEAEFGIKDKASIFASVGGIEVKQSWSIGGVSATYKGTNWYVPIVVRAYSSRGRQPQAFLQAGPVLNFLKAEASATGEGSIENKETKLGATGGFGVRYPLGQSKFAFEGVASYSYVPKMGEIDFSRIEIMAGLGILF